MRDLGFDIRLGTGRTACSASAAHDQLPERREQEISVETSRPVDRMQEDHRKSASQSRGRSRTTCSTASSPATSRWLDHEVVPRHSIYALRHYLTMDPVTGEQFTGRWTPPVKDISVLLTAENQATSTSVVYAIELKNDDAPILVVSDVAKNTFGKIIKLDPNQFWLNNGPQLKGRHTTSTTSPSWRHRRVQAAPAAPRRRSRRSTWRRAR